MKTPGSIEIVISAGLRGNESSKIGTIEVPIRVAEIESMGSHDVQTILDVDTAELQSRIEAFAQQAARSVNGPGIERPGQCVPGRMLGFALDIADDPKFSAKLAERKADQAAYDLPSLMDGPEHVIIGARQTGKTRLALKWLTDCPAGVERVLIVSNDDVARHMRQDCGFTTTDSRIVSYRSLRSGAVKQQSNLEYGIDETVHILMDLLGLRNMPHLITMGHAEDWQGTKEGQ